MDGKSIFLTVWLIVAIFLLTTLYRRGKKALSIFPKIDTKKVKYRERFASGYSTKSWLTKMGGASNVLDIIVTDHELWLKSMIFFAGPGKDNDLLHIIPTKNISKIVQEGKNVKLEFVTKLGESKQVVLKMKKPENFIKALKN